MAEMLCLMSFLPLVFAAGRRHGDVMSFWRALREFFAVQVELHERMALADRPWEEEFLHWAGGELHGWRLPPSGRRVGTTRDGWCPDLTRRA
jgi:hypothetical protein